MGVGDATRRGHQAAGPAGRERRSQILDAPALRAHSGEQEGRRSHQLAGAHEMQSNRGKCQGEAKLTGVGVYDVKAGKLLSLVWVFDGKFRAPPRGI